MLGKERTNRGGATAGARWSPSLGAWTVEAGARFRVWAPEASRVEVALEPNQPGSAGRVEPLEKGADGTFLGLVPGVAAGDRYRYRVDGRGPFPDPASRFQPDGVHGPSEVVDPFRFAWSDAGWRGVEPRDLVVYELHVGTFSRQGTFAGVAEQLPYLRDLGVTAIELMPVAEFAGARSWGYDGVSLFAPSRNYGTPDDLRRLVDEAHRLGLAVILDAVYNHFGPVGNYALEFSRRYLSDSHSSAWAACVNVAGEGSERVREFFIENACHWVHEYHLDGLRLDATHAFVEAGGRPFVAELVETVKASVRGRRVLIHAEDHRNLATMVRPLAEGGWGLDGVWADDLHHQLRRHLAGDDEGYYRDYSGVIGDVVATINDGWFYQGQHSTHLGERRGSDPSGLPDRSFVVCLQSHDQVGNRAFGDRLTATVDLPAYRAATALLLCLSQTPLLFQGQEWAASMPFQYFTDHDPELGRVVTEGRRREFQHFRAFADPASREHIPDPQDPATFARSKLDWSESRGGAHAAVLRLHRTLLRLRRDEPALRSATADAHDAGAVDDGALFLCRDAPGAPNVWLVVRLRGKGPVDLGRFGGTDHHRWEVVLTTEDPDYADDPTPPRVDLGVGAPVVTFERPGAVLFREHPAVAR